MQQFHGIVQQAAFRVQESVNQVRNNNHGNQVGQEQATLKKLGDCQLVQLIHHDGQRNGKHRGGNNEHNVVCQSIADHCECGIRTEQKLKVLKTAPVALERAFDIAVILERKKNADHG